MKAIFKVVGLMGCLALPAALSLAAQTVFGAAKLQLETNEHPGRLSVTSNDNFPVTGFAKETRQVVFYLGQGNFLHSGFPNWLSHDSASAYGTIARTSTVESTTS